MPAENTVLETPPTMSFLFTCTVCGAACFKTLAPSETSQPCSGLKSPQVTQPKTDQQETNSPEQWQPHEVLDYVVYFQVFKQTLTKTIRPRNKCTSINSLAIISKGNNDLILPKFRAKYATSKPLREEEDTKLGNIARF